MAYIEGAYYKPYPIFYDSKGVLGDSVPSNRRVFGIELEVEHSDPEHLAECLEFHLGDLVYFKWDESVMDGFEIVSHPMTYQGLKQAFLSISEVLREEGALSYDTYTCGLHIHTGRTGVLSTTEGCGALCLTVRRLWRALKPISGRRMDELSRWASIPLAPSLDALKRVSDMEAFRWIVSKNTSRYHAINLNNPDTVEFRLMKGTNKFNSLMGSVELFIALIDIAADVYRHGPLTPVNSDTLVKTAESLNLRYLKYLMESRGNRTCAL